MSQKRYRPEVIIANLRETEVLLGQGRKVPEVVKTLGIDEVRGFDPLRDAVVLPEDPVRVEVKKALQVRLKGQDFRLGPGPAELPAYAAVFAMGRGAATMAPK